MPAWSSVAPGWFSQGKLRYERPNRVTAYLDDVIVFGSDPFDHVLNMKGILHTHPFPLDSFRIYFSFHPKGLPS